MKDDKKKRVYEDWRGISMLHGLYFGANLIYYSPVDERMIRCVYVGEEKGRAKVLFYDAEQVSYVEHNRLAWYR